MTSRMWSSPTTPTRRALLAAGIATVAFSLLLSVAPSLAKVASSGTVKIHDAASGTDVTDSNHPSVCGFWVSFSDPTQTETGTWELLSWAPTGDGSVVDSGSYDTTGTGTDVTGTLAPAAGHYRFEWQASGSHNTKNKTLWVTDNCEPTGTVATATPTPTPVVTPTPTPVVTPTPTPVVTPTPTPVVTPTPTSVVTPTPTPVVTPTPTPVVTPTPTPVVTPTPTPVVTPTPTPVVTPTPTPTPSASAPTAPSADPSAAPTDPAQSQPEQEVLSGRSNGGNGTLPDTGMGHDATGLLGALGVLLIVAAHANTRQSKLPDGV